MNIFQRDKISRGDGWLAELYSKKILPNFNCTHSYLVSLQPGSLRAKHYHNFKTEVLAVVYGSIELVTENIISKERRYRMLSTGDSNIELVILPPKVAHVLKNVSEEVSRVVVFSDSHDLEDTLPYDFGSKI